MTRSRRLLVAGALALGALFIPAASALADTPNLTGYWLNDAAGWTLKVSSDLQTLTASWHGGASSGHSTLVGSANGTLNAAGTAYSGTDVVTENGVKPLAGTMTFTIVDLNHITIVFGSVNGTGGTLHMTRNPLLAISSVSPATQGATGVVQTKPVAASGPPLGLIGLLAGLGVIAVGGALTYLRMAAGVTAPAVADGPPVDTASPAAADLTNAGAAPPQDSPAQQDQQQKPDPCQAEINRMAAASANSHALQASLQQLRAMRDTLEQQRELARESGYMNASVDLAATAAPWLAGTTLAPGAALMVNVLRGMGGEVLKDLSNFALDQGVDLQGLVSAGVGVSTVGPDGTPIAGTGGASQQALGELIKKFLMSRAKNQLAKSGAAVTDSALKSLEENMAGPLSDMFGNLVSLGSIGSGVMDVSRTLAQFDSYISKIQSAISSAEQSFDTAMQEMDLARSALNYCRTLHPLAPG
ncbi:MAG TPA: hypothetical protein VF137_09025 [Candidatus Dormibacteraeota bacterium]